MPGKKKGKAKSSQATKAQTVSTRPQNDDKHQDKPKSGSLQQGLSKQLEPQQGQPSEPRSLINLVEENEAPLLDQLKIIYEGPIPKVPEGELNIEQKVVQQTQTFIDNFEIGLSCSFTAGLLKDAVVVVGDGVAYTGPQDKESKINSWLEKNNISSVSNIAFVNPPENLAIYDYLVRSLSGIVNGEHKDNPGIPVLKNSNKELGGQLEAHEKAVKAVDEKIEILAKHIDDLKKKSNLKKYIPKILRQGPVISVIFEYAGMRAALLFPAINNTFGKFAEDFLTLKAAKQPQLKQSRSVFDATEEVIAFPNRALRSPNSELLGEQSVISLINGETYATADEEKNSDKKIDDKHNPNALKQLKKTITAKTLRPHMLARRIVPEFEQLKIDFQKIDIEIKQVKDNKHGVAQAPTKDSVVTAWGLFKKAVKSHAEEVKKASEDLEKSIKDRQHPAKTSDRKDNDEEFYPKAPGDPSLSSNVALAANSEQKKSAKKKKKKKQSTAASDPVSPKMSESKNHLFTKFSKEKVTLELIVVADKIGFLDGVPTGNVKKIREKSILHVDIKILTDFLREGREYLLQENVYFSRNIVKLICGEIKLKKTIKLFTVAFKALVKFVGDTDEFLLIEQVNDKISNVFCMSTNRIIDFFIKCGLSESDARIKMAGVKSGICYHYKQPFLGVEVNFTNFVPLEEGFANYKPAQNTSIKLSCSAE